MTPLIYLAIGVLVGAVGLWIDYRWYHILHSLLFVAILVPLSIFVASSTGNPLGQGVVCALLVGLFGEMLALYRSPEKFNQHFKGGAKPLTAREIRYGVLGFGILTVVVVGITLL